MITHLKTSTLHICCQETLPINFSSWNHTNQTTNNESNFSIHINRALTRLKSVFVTLHTTDTAEYKEANSFYHPMGFSVTEAYNFSLEHQVWVQIGSKHLPEYQISGVSEAYYQLKKAVGIPFHIMNRWYRTRRYIVGLDCEKISGAGFTGMNTKAGDLLTVNFRNCGAEGNRPNRMYCALNYDAVLNTKDAGVELMD